MPRLARFEVYTTEYLDYVTDLYERTFHHCKASSRGYDA